MTGWRSRRGSSAGLYATRYVLGVGAAPRRPPALDVPPAGRRPRRDERPTVPPPAGARTGAPVLVVLTVDESPSEHAADPFGHRHLAGRRIVELLRTDLRHPGDRVAVVHFADRPGPWRGPTDPHTFLGHRRLRRALRPAGGGPGTDICAALDVATRLVPRSWPGPVVVVLLSDGYDHNDARALAAAAERLPPGAVHLVSVGVEPPYRWAGVPLGSSCVVQTAAWADEVEWAAAEALYTTLGVPWTGS